MPGVGPVLAFTPIALLPELGRMSRKQIAALVGGWGVDRRLGCRRRLRQRRFAEGSRPAGRCRTRPRRRVLVPPLWRGLAALHLDGSTDADLARCGAHGGLART